jgi:hypothetical protein
VHAAPRGTWEIDHVAQRAKGGARRVANCLPACLLCNRLRWHRTGSAIRALLILGFLAHGEIRRGTRLGRDLAALRVRRLSRNEARRKQRGRKKK